MITGYWNRPALVDFFEFFALVSFWEKKIHPAHIGSKSNWENFKFYIAETMAVIINTYELFVPVNYTKARIICAFYRNINDFAIFCQP